MKVTNSQTSTLLPKKAISLTDVYSPPLGLKNGFLMTIYAGLRASKTWEGMTFDPTPPYHNHIFQGANQVPIFGWVAIPKNPKGTIVGTYGITGDLENQWFLKILQRKAFAQGYAVVLFDWRGHGKTAELSPTLTSDGLYEGEDFVRIAAQSKNLGCPAPFWFTGYSLGGQLALWGIKMGQTLSEWGADLGLRASELAGGAVICPSLDSERSLSYLVKHPLGKHLERAITYELKKLIRHLDQVHPNTFDRDAIKRVNSILAFDHELVIGRLGFSSVEDYYQASNGLRILPEFQKPTLILYAKDDPFFDPTIIPDLETIAKENPALDLLLTEHGGHIGYISSKACQRLAQDPDRWWAWNRVLEWINHRTDNN